jgi:hypothetical protein
MPKPPTGGKHPDGGQLAAALPDSTARLMHALAATHHHCLVCAIAIPSCEPSFRQSHGGYSTRPTRKKGQFPQSLDFADSYNVLSNIYNPEANNSLKPPLAAN